VTSLLAVSAPTQLPPYTLDAGGQERWVNSCIPLRTYEPAQDFSTMAHPTAIVCKLLYWVVFSDLSAPALWPITYFEPMRGVHKPGRGSCASPINMFPSGQRASLGRGLPVIFFDGPCPRAPIIYPASFARPQVTVRTKSAFHMGQTFVFVKTSALRSPRRSTTLTSPRRTSGC